MGRFFGSAKPSVEDGYGEAPIQPNYNHLPNLHFVRILDKVSSNGKRVKRAVLLSSKALVLCEAGSFKVRRIVDIRKISRAVLQGNPRDPNLMGPAEGQALLLKLPDEYDLILAQARGRKAGYGNKLDVERLAQTIAACKKHDKQEFDIKKVTPDEDVYRSAYLVRPKGFNRPNIQTFRELEVLLDTHDPIPDTVAVDPLEEPPEEDVKSTQGDGREKQEKSDFYKVLFPTGGGGGSSKGGKSNFGNTTVGTIHTNGHTGEWRGYQTDHECSIPGDAEGVLCDHPMPTIPHNHWSCCGALQHNSQCLKEHQSQPGSPILFVTKPPNPDRRSGRFSENSAFNLDPLLPVEDQQYYNVGYPQVCNVCTTGKRRLVSCKKCGCIACDRCAAYSLRVPGQYGAVKVCNPCFIEAGEGGGMRANSVASRSAPPSSDGEGFGEKGGFDAAVAAVVAIAVLAANKRKKKRKKKQQQQQQQQQQQPSKQLPSPSPYPYYTQTPQPQPRPRQHVAASYFTPPHLAMWQNSGAAVEKEAWMDPMRQNNVQQGDGDKFWTGFIEEWEGVSKAVAL